MLYLRNFHIHTHCNKIVFLKTLNILLFFLLFNCCDMTQILLQRDNQLKTQYKQFTIYLYMMLTKKITGNGPHSAYVIFDGN